MWGRLTGYFSGKGNADGGPASPNANAYAKQPGGGGAVEPHTLLVHFVLHDAESLDASRLLADTLSREFAFGMPSAQCWKSTGDLASCVADGSSFLERKMHSGNISGNTFPDAEGFRKRFRLC